LGFLSGRTTAELGETGSLQCLSPLRFDLKLINPSLDICAIEFVVSNPKYSRNVFDLAFGRTLFRPFEFREDDIFRACHENRQALEFDWKATIELAQAKFPLFADDEIDLPATGEIDDVELTPSFQLVQRIFKVEVVVGLGQNVLQDSKLFWCRSHNEIEIVRGPGCSVK
jgi:hypothetical protein